MIIGLGIDLVDNDRIRHSLERFGERFCEKMLHASERDALPRSGGITGPVAVAHLASRFAAKEAAVKALGSGFAEGIGLHDVRVCSLPSGKPELTFHGKAAELAASLGVSGAHLSLTHTPVSSAAVVVLEGTAGGHPGEQR